MICRRRVFVFKDAKIPVPTPTNCISFVSEGAQEVRFVATQSPSVPFSVQYSTDGINWSAVEAGRYYSFVNNRIFLRGKCSRGTAKSVSSYYKIEFRSLSNVSCSGNIMHLVDYEQNITSLSSGICFCSLFKNETRLVSAPELPATTLVSSCYHSMFYGCNKLTQAPDLPALTPSQGAYTSMFYNCTSLNKIKAMFTSTPSTSYSSFSRGWVYGVAATGTFTKNRNATWSIRGDYAIPTGWTIVTA